MTARDTATIAPPRRRPSISFRNRPRTATTSGALPPSLEHQEWNGLAFPEEYDNQEEQVPDDTSQSAEAVPRRRPSRSFSNLRHPVDGLRALGRRLSVTIRNKSSKQTLQSQFDDIDSDGRSYHFSSSSWDARPRNSSFKYSINRRPSLNSVSALHSFYAPTASVPAPIPGNGLEPPILPNDMGPGSAARAAAAAQNEMARAERDAVKSRDAKITLDSESGIGIDLRDRTDGSETELAVVRLDPVRHLPSEITSQVLSYLDPKSLMQAELVSRAWNEQAISRHVWRHVFRRAYRHRRPSVTSSKKKQSAGLGKTLPNQNWKRMFLVRRALEHRWKEGKAAAIYLHGHKDSVYCAQFDENKIITGSRDRTIRVWDAHYPWPCLKIIGPPPGDVPGIGPVNNPIQQSAGKSPFLTICPPSTSSAGIVSPMEQPSDYHSASILCLQFDDEIMVTGSSDYTCIVWDIKNDYKPIRRLEGHRAGVLDVCFDDRFVVSCSKDTTICVWDRHTGALVKKLLGHRGPVNAVQLRGDLVVSASGDGVAKLWNITSGLCIKEFPSKDRGLACVEFSDDARTILTGGNDQVIYQFDANSGEMVNELKGHVGLVRSLHLDSLNQRIVSGSYDMSVKVFDVQSGELSIDLPGWTTSWMLSVKSDYRRIVATSQDSRAVIMDFGYGLDGIDLLEE
ncbi:F-box/WD repeat-containing protein [Aspergillus chevalieri]|uniref:Probable E3 ubiquitin ligase complex SCF subunit sconB n=1 Tax=Aspergillus chevalieri TaxID=182096 RepID=A0A7R7VJE4_ASPCH|nr:uncharacterized protein ACHE_21182S [Aspergillus chevalieri]BCR85724.1 hypothetical protein ACHE_21182S [Aspergillus chevalieri]